MSSSSSAATLMDEFQAFVTRVKQLHMSRSADADCEQPLSHDKARRRLLLADNAAVTGARGPDNAPADELLKPHCESPLFTAKSLDDQQLRRDEEGAGDIFGSSSADVQMEVDDKQTETTAARVKEEANANEDDDVVKNESKEVKKNIQVMVGIDEDLKMILEMDPEIVDLGGLEKPVAEPKVMGLPPVSSR